MKSKRLTAKAALTIPKDLRIETGLFGGMAVDLIPQEDCSILIRKHVPACWVCGSAEDVVTSWTIGHDVCADCASEIREEFESICKP